MATFGDALKDIVLVYGGHTSVSEMLVEMNNQYNRLYLYGLLECLKTVMESAVKSFVNQVQRTSVRSTSMKHAQESLVFESSSGLADSAKFEMHLNEAITVEDPSMIPSEYRPYIPAYIDRIKEEFRSLCDILNNAELHCFSEWLSQDVVTDMLSENEIKAISDQGEMQSAFMHKMRRLLVAMSVDCCQCPLRLVQIIHALYAHQVFPVLMDRTQKRLKECKWFLDKAAENATKYGMYRNWIQDTSYNCARMENCLRCAKDLIEASVDDTLFGDYINKGLIIQGRRSGIEAWQVAAREHFAMYRDQNSAKSNRAGVVGSLIFGEADTVRSARRLLQQSGREEDPERWGYIVANVAPSNPELLSPLEPWEV